MSEYDYDLFVIGGGSGGVRAARWSAGLGAKVAICENDRYGGTCVIRGCVPKKLMVYLSEFSHSQKVMEKYGWKSQAKLNWNQFKEIRDAEISRLSGIYTNLLENKDVDHYEGKGSLLDKHTVEVAGKTYSAKNILIATGSKGVRPEFPGSEHCIISDQIFHLDEVPKRLLVVGSGFVGTEFSCIFNGLGSEVTLAIRKERILIAFDKESACFTQKEMERNGVKVLTKTNLKEVKKENNELVVITDRGELRVDQVLLAIGRAPNIDGLNLDKIGVELNPDNSIKINDKFQTNIDNIYAVGDVTNKMNLTPVATAQGTRLSENLFNGKDYVMNYENIPQAVFTQPEYASVGKTEEQVLAEGIKAEIYTASFRALKYTLGSEDRTLMKMIVEKKSQKVIGAHMVGDGAAESIQTLAVAIKAGATKADFDSTIGIHPTSGEEWLTLRSVTREI